MTSVFLTRRTMLSGGAILGLGTLLAACGQQAANEASASASSTATPSETASASTTAAESPSASATPSTIRGYSGQSKAPPTVNTAKLTATVLPRTFRSPRAGNNTPKLRRVLST